MGWIRVTAIFVAIAAAIADHARADIPIGFSSALTGPYAWVGEPHLAGTELAIADLNAKGGVLGEPLELIVVDDGCNAELAPLAAEKLVSEAVAVAFGATCSGAAIPASKVYRRAGILMIEAGATNPRLTEEGEGGVFRIVGRDDRQGTIGGDYLADRWSEQQYRDCPRYFGLRPRACGGSQEAAEPARRQRSSVYYLPARRDGLLGFAGPAARGLDRSFVSRGLQSGGRPHHSPSPRPQVQCPTGRRGLAVDWRVLVGGRPGRRRSPVHVLQRSHA